MILIFKPSKILFVNVFCVKKSLQKLLLSRNELVIDGDYHEQHCSLDALHLVDVI